MQEFENGDEVEVTYAESGQKRKATWIGLSDLLHVVQLEGGQFCEFGDDYVCKLQLICDKAREKLHTIIQYKVKVDSDALLAEFNKYRKEWTGYLVLNTDRCTSHDIAFYNDDNVPELNLSTGEITGGDTHVFENPKGYDKTTETIDLLKENQKLESQLKEKDAEIERLKKDNKKLGGQIRDYHNETQKIKKQNNFMSEKVALYTVALAELDYSVNKIENM